MSSTCRISPATRHELEGEIGAAASAWSTRRAIATRPARRAQSDGCRVGWRGAPHRAPGAPWDCSRTRNRRAADGRVFYAMKLVAGKRADRYLEDQPRSASAFAWCSAWARRWPTRTAAACCIATSSRRTSLVGAFGEVYVMDWGVDGVAGTRHSARLRAASTNAPTSIRWAPCSASSCRQCRRALLAIADDHESADPRAI